MTPLRFVRSLAVMWVAALPCMSCAPSHAPVRPVVLVSVPPQAWLVDRLAGDRIEVEVMVPPGADPHVYEPTIRQMRAASRAAIYVKVGHPHFTFERVWFDRLLAENPRMRVVDGSEGAELYPGDPHLWTSVAVMRTMAIHTADALAATLPSHAQEVRARLADLEADLDTLDAGIRRMLAPCRGRTLLVLHPAWGYFAEDYGLVQVAIEHEGKSPAPADLARIIAAARRSGTRRVFVQPQTSPAGAQVVADEIGGRIVTLDPLARDWAANMHRVAAAIREGCTDE
jgi:zinc transport system substrate-binding protein